MKQVLTDIVKSLVDNPDSVMINETAGVESTVFELRVAPNDLGKVIGKGGRTATAMRILLIAAGTKLKRRLSLEILER